MTFGRGIVRGYDAATGLVTVQLVGGHSGTVNMPALTSLSAANLVAGRRCLVVFFDDSNPSDGCVVGTYDTAADALGDHDHSGDAGDGGLIAGRFVPLVTPLTSTAWDGDAKNGASGVIDLSAVFGAPAGIKAIAVNVIIQAATAGLAAALVPVSTQLADGLFVNAAVANQLFSVGGVVPCDGNGDVYFYQTGDLSAVHIRITGYWL
jgi:hypothetical protein